MKNRLFLLFFLLLLIVFGCTQGTEQPIGPDIAQEVDSYGMYDLNKESMLWDGGTTAPDVPFSYLKGAWMDTNYHTIHWTNLIEDGNKFMRLDISVGPDPNAPGAYWFVSGFNTGGDMQGIGIDLAPYGNALAFIARGSTEEGRELIDMEIRIIGKGGEWGVTAINTVRMSEEWKEYILVCLVGCHFFYIFVCPQDNDAKLGIIAFSR